LFWHNLLLNNLLEWASPRGSSSECSGHKIVLEQNVQDEGIPVSQEYLFLDVSYSQGGDRSLVTNYRPVSLTSVVCKQMEHVIASYLRQVWDKNYWLYEGQHGFRPGYSCESQVITVCQGIADSLDNGDRIDAIIADFSIAFDLLPHGRLLTKIANSGLESRVVV
jgi:hypothetical protein